MSGTVDVGDAVELTFNSAPGATVTVSWLDPNNVAVLDQVPVAETPAGSGKYLYTFLPTLPGIWQARFTASGTATAVEQYYLRATVVTGPPPLATVGEVAAQFGTLSQAQEALAGTLLRAASKMVRAKFPPIDSQMASGVVDPEVVALGVVAMVLRVLRNPSGLRSESVGPFSRAYDTSAAAGLLVITDDDESLFKPPTTRLGRARTIMARPGLAPYPYGARRWM